MTCSGSFFQTLGIKSVRFVLALGTTSTRTALVPLVVIFMAKFLLILGIFLDLILQHGWIREQDAIPLLLNELYVAVLCIRGGVLLRVHRVLHTLVHQARIIHNVLGPIHHFVIIHLQRRR